MKSKFIALVVLLGGIAFSFGTFAKPRPASVQDWQESPKTDSHGTTYTQYTLAGRFIKRPHAEVSAQPSLVVGCELGKESRWSKAGFRDGTLRVGAPLKIEYVEPEEIHGNSYLQRNFVEYRLDDGKVEREKWTPGADKTSVSLPKDAFRKFLGAHTVLITVYEDPAGEIEMQFDMPDSAKVAQACHLHVHRK
jgi:hypothetical protein